MVSYDVFDEDYYRIELYSKGKINSTNYYVDKNFYEICKDDIKQFLEQSGYTCMWEGEATVCADSVLERKPIGIVVISTEYDLSEYKNEFGKLYDGTDCILEENSLDLYPQGQFYQFFSIKQERWELSEAEKRIIEAYQNQEIDMQTGIKLLASEMISDNCELCSNHLDKMGKFQDIIYSRESLYSYLLKTQMQEEQAIYWTELIRRGTLKRKLQQREISYSDYAELYLAIGKEGIDLFSCVRYLPSWWSILERFHRLKELKNTQKVIAVDFDGTLSLGTWPQIGPANEELISFLKEQKKKGDKLILWTCREGEALKEAIEWCSREGLEFDAVNDNIPEIIKRYGTNSRKVSCDYYIDDRAVWTNAFGLLR